VLERTRLALTSVVASSEGRLSAVRIRLDGASGAHEALAKGSERVTEEIRALASDLPGEAWLEKVELPRGRSPRAQRSANARMRSAKCCAASAACSTTTRR